MKIEIKVKKEFDVKYLQVKAGVRHWEDATVNSVEDTDGYLIPLRDNDLWCPLIKIESGIILNWPKGTTAKIHYKVCDAGSYYLQDEKRNDIISIEDYYVPKILDLYNDSYGDYIILNVDGNGKIADWNNNPNIDDFQNNDED